MTVPDTPVSAPRIAVLAACFNRRDTTLRGLAAMRLAATGVDYRVYLVDDGSTDGTADAVTRQFPEVQVITGDGGLFWNGGMRRAWQVASADAPDYYLWWNDDLELLPDALAKLLAYQQEQESAHGTKVIAIGKVLDPATAKVTYGGYAAVPGASRLRFSRAGDDGLPCATMNGNCVLIPARALAEVGTLSPHYTHAMGDVDYGLRAAQAGYRLMQSLFPVGYTPFNMAFHAAHARLTPANWRFMLTHPKGWPVREWLHFCRVHAGWKWPVNFAWRYLKIMRLQ